MVATRAGSRAAARASLQKRAATPVEPLSSSSSWSSSSEASSSSGESPGPDTPEEGCFVSTAKKDAGTSDTAPPREDPLRSPTRRISPRKTSAKMQQKNLSRLDALDALKKGLPPRDPLLQDTSSEEYDGDAERGAGAHSDALDKDLAARELEEEDVKRGERKERASPNLPSRSLAGRAAEEVVAKTTSTSVGKRKAFESMPAPVLAGSTPPPSPPRAEIQAEREAWRAERRVTERLLTAGGSSTSSSTPAAAPAGTRHSARRASTTRGTASLKSSAKRRSLQTTGSQSDDGDEDSIIGAGVAAQPPARKRARHSSTLPSGFYSPVRRQSLQHQDVPFVSLVERSYGVSPGTQDLASDASGNSDSPGLDEISNESVDHERDLVATALARKHARKVARGGDEFVPAFLPELPVRGDDDDVLVVGSSPATLASRRARQVRVDKALLHPAARPRPPRSAVHQTTLLSMWNGDGERRSSRGTATSWGRDGGDDYVFGPATELRGSSDDEFGQRAISSFMTKVLPRRSHGSDESGSDDDMDGFIVDDSDERALASQVPKKKSGKSASNMRERAQPVPSTGIETDDDLLEMNVLHQTAPEKDTDDEILEELQGDFDEPARSSRRGSKLRKKRRLRKSVGGTNDSDESSASSSWNLLEDDDPDVESDDRPTDFGLADDHEDLSIFQRGPLRQRDAFDRYVQFIASCVCDSDFFQAMRAASGWRSYQGQRMHSDSEDDPDVAKDRDAAMYFREAEVRIRDAVWRRFELLMRSSAWNNEFQADLERCGKFRSWPAEQGEGSVCEVCRRRGHPVAFELALSGPRYNARDVWERGVQPPVGLAPQMTTAAGQVDEDSSSSEDGGVTLYLIGRNCHERTQLFHSLYHYVLHLWQRVEKRVRRDIEVHLTEVLREKSHANRTPPRASTRVREEANVAVVQALLSDKLFLPSLYREFCGLLETADTFARKDMTRH